MSVLEIFGDLPDFYSHKLAIALSDTVEENLQLIGIEYQLRSGEVVDWVGTCDGLVWQLMQRPELFAKDAD